MDINLATHLAQQVRLFDAVASTTPDFIYVFDPEGRFQYANRRLLEVWGLSLEDVIGKTCLELGYEPWHHDMHMREIAHVVATKQAVTGEVPFRAPRTGIFGVYEYIFTPVLDAAGEVELIAGTTRDVSERTRVEEALRTSEERLAIALQAGQLGFWDWDLISGSVVYGGCWASMLGYTIDEIEPHVQAWERLVHPDDRARVIAVLDEHLAGRSDFYESEHRLRHRDGSWRWILDRGRVVEREADGGPLRALGTHLDITARKLAEQNQRRSTELLQFLAQLSADLVPLASTVDIVRRAGARIGEHFRLSRLDFCTVEDGSDEVRVFHEWLAKPAVSGIGTHRLANYLDADLIADLTAGRVVSVPDVRQDPRTAVRRSRYASWSLVSLVFAPHLRAGTIMLLVFGVDEARDWSEDEIALIREVAERVHILVDRAEAEAGLRKSESFYRQTLESIPGMSFTNTPDGAYEYVSAQWVDYTGMPAQQHLGTGWVNVLHPDDRERAMSAWRAAVTQTGVYDLEYRVRRHDGVYEWFKVWGQAIRNEGGNVARWIGTAVNVDSLKRAEEALRDSDRQKDEFLAMLAHELRNPLAPIRASASILRARGSTDPVLQRSRDIIDRQAAHMARLLDDLLDISRLSRGRLTLQRAATELRPILEAAIETSRPLIDERDQELVLEGVDEAVVLYADAARLTQVFANLLNNAAKYNHPGGRIEMSVDRGSEWVEIRVRDSGLGIEAELLDRVFELFVQGAHARQHGGGGLGIGLSLARRLIEMHGGRIAAESQGPGSGSTFRVSLPILAGEATDTRVDGTSDVAPLATRRILIADDNEDAADSAALLFESLGCEVRTVYGGEAAVREAQRFHPNVVLLDLGMPDVDGYEACRRIRDTAGGARMLLVAVSGWGRDADLQRSAAAGFDHHFLKPVDPNALIRLIGEERRACG